MKGEKAFRVAAKTFSLPQSRDVPAACKGFDPGPGRIYVSICPQVRSSMHSAGFYDVQYSCILQLLVLGPHGWSIDPVRSCMGIPAMHATAIWILHVRTTVVQAPCGPLPSGSDVCFGSDLGVRYSCSRDGRPTSTCHEGTSSWLDVLTAEPGKHKPSNQLSAQLTNHQRFNF